MPENGISLALSIARSRIREQNLYMKSAIQLHSARRPDMIENQQYENRPKIIAVWLATFAALFGVSNVGLSQVTLSVSPSVTSNNYTGVITLNLTGLTNGEKCPSKNGWT